MIRVRITNPDLSNYDLEKKADHPKLNKFLRDRGVIGWDYSRGSDFLELLVIDGSDLSQFSRVGTVEVVPHDVIDEEPSS